MKFIKLIFLFFLCFFNKNFSKAAITYQVSSGRLGDRLTYYCVAKQLAIKYGLQFYYRPFKYSDRLVLSKIDLVYADDLFKGYKKVEIGHEFDALPDLDKDILYIVTERHWKFSSFDYRWCGLEEYALSDLKSMIQPLYEIKKIDIPNNVISVALHVRIGQGYDTDSDRERAFRKFPKEEFFIESIKKIKKHFEPTFLYVYIFTDAYNKQAVVEQLKNKLNDPSVFFAPLEKSTSGQPWDESVLEDLFSMAQFDCLVRPHSCYSIIAQLIGNHKYIIFPDGEILN